MRLRHFDVLKGIAIFLVVMGHVITVCIRDLDRATIFKIISAVHMPLFFFISGWLTFGLKPDGALKTPRLGRRFRQLIVPMVVVSTLWIYYFPHSGLQSPFESTWSGLWLSSGKNGYWFPLCLFEIFVIYSLLRPILGRASDFGAGAAVCLIAWAVIWAVTLYTGAFCPTVADGLGLEHLTIHFPGFMTGYMASRHRRGFDRAVNSPVVCGIALIAGALTLYYQAWWWDFGPADITVRFVPLAAAAFYICLAIIAIAAVRPWTDSAPADSRPMRLWTLLGTNSLGIYLLHYFFLFPMGVLRPALDAMNVAIVPMLAVSALTAAAVIAVTLLVIRILRTCTPLARLLTGQ